jgi:hypothetical protein
VFQICALCIWFKTSEFQDGLSVGMCSGCCANCDVLQQHRRSGAQIGWSCKKHLKTNPMQSSILIVGAFFWQRKQTDDLWGHTLCIIMSKPLEHDSSSVWTLD